MSVPEERNKSVIAFESSQARLSKELHQIAEAIWDLRGKSGIEEFRQDPNSNVLVLVHPYFWKTLPIEHRADQAQLLGRYRHWYELVQRCHIHHSSDVQESLDQINAHILSAIELKSDWGTACSIQQNRASLSERISLFHQLLNQHVPAEPDFVLVPDTNALLKAADPSQYAGTIDCQRFRFIIVPTVLAELDELKRVRGTQPVGQKAEKAIRAIKGLRNQGSVRNGVTVSRTITVQMIPTEPKMSSLPSWLDADNHDDRIIGSVLGIQCAQPSATVVLVTDDLNLQNKAEMAFLPWAEPPEQPTGRLPDAPKAEGM
jgi:hypothetical protein